MLAFQNIYMNKKKPYRVYVCFKRFSVIISICDVRFLDKALCNLHIRACMSECFISFMNASVCAKSWSLHKINPSSKNVFIVLFSLHLNSFILFHSTQNISFGNYMGPKCVLWKFMSNHCWKRIYVRVSYCVGIVGIWFCTGKKKSTDCLNNGVVWIYVVASWWWKKTEMQTLRYARTQSVVCFAHAHVHEIYMGICDSSYATAVFLVNLFKMRTCIRSYRDSMILPMPETWIFHSLRQIEPMILKLCQPNTNQQRNDQPAKKMNQVTGNNKKKAFEQLSASDECHKL